MVTNPQSFDDLATLVRLDALHALTAIVDTGGTVRNANHAWAAAAERAETGLPPLAPVGGNLPAILRERAGGNPQDGAVLRALEASLCRGDAPVPLTYTGRAEPVPRSFLVEIDALAEGGASVTYVDVTLRRQINDILRAVAHVAAQVKEGSVVVDLQGTIQFADAGWADWAQ